MPKKISEAKNENVKPEENAPEKIVIPTKIQKSLATKAEQMKASLDSQPKVSIMIPFEKGEKKGAVQPFCMNGYKFTVPKGTMVQVPEQVAEMISERFKVDLEIRGRSLDQQSGDRKTALE